MSRSGAVAVHGAAGGGGGPAPPVPRGGPADAAPIRAGDSRRVDSARDARRSNFRSQLTHRSGNGGGERGKGGRSDPGTGTMEKQFVQRVYSLGERRRAGNDAALGHINESSLIKVSKGK